MFLFISISQPFTPNPKNILTLSVGMGPILDYSSFELYGAKPWGRILSNQNQNVHKFIFTNVLFQSLDEKLLEIDPKRPRLTLANI